MLEKFCVAQSVFGLLRMYVKVFRAFLRPANGSVNNRRLCRASSFFLRTARRRWRGGDARKSARHLFRCGNARAVMAALEVLVLF